MINLRISNKIIIQKAPKEIIKPILKLFTIDNPIYISNIKRGYSNFKTPKFFYLAEENSGDLLIKRGCLYALTTFLIKNNIEYKLIYRTRSFGKLGVNFNGKLTHLQKKAVKDFEIVRDGVLCAPTGAGKTVMALYLIAARNVPTIIIVHTKTLVDQWRNSTTAFFNIPKEEIGQLGGKKNILKPITVTTVQTLAKVSGDICDKFGHVIIDECHRQPSNTFQKAIEPFYSKYILGLTATPIRSDKLEKLIFGSLGHIIHSVDKKVLNKNKSVLVPEIKIIKTDFRIKPTTTRNGPKNTTINVYPDIANEYNVVIDQLVNDNRRNIMICQGIIANRHSGMCCVLVDRVYHAKILQQILHAEGYGVTVLHGKLKKEEREEITKDLSKNRINILIATGQLIGEGFDCKYMTNLFLVAPIKYDGRLIQYIGRILRPMPGKKPVVFDYVDQFVPTFKRNSMHREILYKKEFEYKG
jgi:superfamily II DNA or RNA helicase